MDSASPPSSSPRTPSSAVRLVVVWLVVAVPALWGVSQTVVRSLELFRSHPPAATPASAPVDKATPAATTPPPAAK